MHKSIEDDTVEFLQESNAIEGVYDPRSLDDAVAAWVYLIAQRRIGVRVIRNTHKILMRRQRILDQYRGEFRDVPVYINQKQALPYTIIRPLIEVWVREMNRGRRDWKELHVEYEKIHPFIDGNGRTGRMFMNWYRLKKANLPILVIKEEDRFKYYKWFK